jgi:hypothetical protein
MRLTIRFCLSQEEWTYVGKIRSHTAPMSGLHFGVSAEGAALLLSVGEDRHLVEYNLETSCVEGGIQLRSRTRIEQSAVPTSVLFHPMLPGQREDFVITTNSGECNAECEAGGSFRVCSIVVIIYIYIGSELTS